MGTQGSCADGPDAPSHDDCGSTSIAEVGKLKFEPSSFPKGVSDTKYGSYAKDQPASTSIADEGVPVAEKIHDEVDAKSLVGPLGNIGSRAFKREPTIFTACTEKGAVQRNMDRRTAAAVDVETKAEELGPEKRFPLRDLNSPSKKLPMSTGGSGRLESLSLGRASPGSGNPVVDRDKQNSYSLALLHQDFQIVPVIQSDGEESDCLNKKAATVQLSSEGIASPSVSQANIVRWILQILKRLFAYFVAAFTIKRGNNVFSSARSSTGAPPVSCEHRVFKRDDGSVSEEILGEHHIRRGEQAELSEESRATPIFPELDKESSVSSLTSGNWRASVVAKPDSCLSHARVGDASTDLIIHRDKEAVALREGCSPVALNLALTCQEKQGAKKHSLSAEGILEAVQVIQGPAYCHAATAEGSKAKEFGSEKPGGAQTSPRRRTGGKNTRYANAKDGGDTVEVEGLHSTSLVGARNGTAAEGEAKQSWDIITDVKPPAEVARLIYSRSASSETLVHRDFAMKGATADDTRVLHDGSAVGVDLTKAQAPTDETLNIRNQISPVKAGVHNWKENKRKEVIEGRKSVRRRVLSNRPFTGVGNEYPTHFRTSMSPDSAFSNMERLLFQMGCTLEFNKKSVGRKLKCRATVEAGRELRVIIRCDGADDGSTIVKFMRTRMSSFRSRASDFVSFFRDVHEKFQIATRGAAIQEEPEQTHFERMSTDIIGATQG